MTLELKPGVTLYLSRHGQTEANVAHRFSGKLDTPLTPKGREQAHHIGELLKREVGVKPKLDFVASPLRRAQLTMGIVREVLELPPSGFATDPRIQEIDLGDWDELTDEQARALDPALFDKRVADKWNVHVPNGENYEEVARRACEWATGLSADTFAVSHGACTRILRGLFMSLDWKKMSELDEPQGVVFRIRGHAVEMIEN